MRRAFASLRLPLLAALCAGLAVAAGAAQARPGTAVAVPYDDLPQDAKAAFAADYFAGPQAGACLGRSIGLDTLSIGPVLKTDYNGDGAPDFIFNQPCAAPGGRAAPVGRLVASTPFGYRVVEDFTAALGEMDGVFVLALAQPCGDEAASDAACYVGRRWDRKAGGWGPLEPLTNEADAVVPVAEAKGLAGDARLAFATLPLGPSPFMPPGPPGPETAPFDAPY